MKIAFIHPSYPYSEGTGSTHDATQIINTIQNQGHEVVPYCMTEPSDCSMEYEVITNDKYFSHTLTRLNKAIRERTDELAEFDIVHSYLSLVPALDDLAHQTSVAVTLNSYKALCPKMDLRYMDREMCEQNGLKRCARCSLATSGGHADQGRVYRSLSRLGDLRLINKTNPQKTQIDAFQAISTHIKDTYAGFGYPENRIWEIPNILDKKFLIDHSTDFESPYKLLYVGFLRKAKGVHLLPKLVKQLNKRSTYEFKLTVVGDGPLRNKLEQRIREVNISSLVDFCGYIEDHDDLPQIYANHDLFVYPGLWNEPFGRVFLESLAAGTPVVGTDVGAVETIVRNAGVVTESTSIGLAKSIDQLISEQKLSKLSANAQVQAKRYLPESIGPLFDKMYKNIV